MAFVPAGDVARVKSFRLGESPGSAGKRIVGQERLGRQIIVASALFHLKFEQWTITKSAD